MNPPFSICKYSISFVQNKKEWRHNLQSSYEKNNLNVTTPFIIRHVSEIIYMKILEGVVN